VPLALPEPIHPIGIEDVIDADEGYPFNQTLRNQQVMDAVTNAQQPV